MTVPRPRDHAAGGSRIRATGETRIRALAAAATLIALTGCTMRPMIDLQGHRGARGHYPENTLEGFERALRMGVSTLELDTGVSRDGIVVVGHDMRLNHEITRDAAGRWIAAPGPLINSLTLAELQRFDVGRIDPASPYAQRFPAQQGADGVRIPRLADVFALTDRLGARTVRFNVETKINPEEPDAAPAPAPFARALLAVIREHRIAARTTIQSFDWRTLSVVQQEAPEVATVYLTAEQPWYDSIRRAAPASPWTDGIQFRDHGSVPRMIRAAASRAGVAGVASAVSTASVTWSPYFADLTVELRAEARALGIKVVVWTVNEPADIERMLDWSVDGIISDYPDRVRDALTRRGLPVPAKLAP